MFDGQAQKTNKNRKCVVWKQLYASESQHILLYALALQGCGTIEVIRWVDDGSDGKLFYIIYFYGGHNLYFPINASWWVVVLVENTTGKTYNMCAGYQETE